MLSTWLNQISFRSFKFRKSTSITVVVSEKDNLTVKRQYLYRTFLELFTTNLNTDVMRTLLRYESDTGHAVSQFEFSLGNLQGVTLWLPNRCFRGQKLQGNIYFEEILLTCFRFFCYGSSTYRDFLIEPIRPGKRYFPKLDLLSSFVEVEWT